VNSRSSTLRRLTLAVLFCAVMVLAFGQAARLAAEDEPPTVASQPADRPARGAVTVASQAARSPAVREPVTRAPVTRAPATMKNRSVVPIRASVTTAELTTAEPHFESSVEPVGGMLAYEIIASRMWRPDCPITLDELRVISVTYWDFDGRARTGRLVVNRAWADKLCGVFRELFDARFPIRRMDPVDWLGANGHGLTASDNTMGYNGRRMRGSDSWSMHAYGLAIDINPVENPYIKKGSVTPPLGAGFAYRAMGGQGMVTDPGVVVQAFKSIGWKWGGDWKTVKDYMHFSSNGK